MNQHLLSLYSISYLYKKIIYNILFNYQHDNKKNYLTYFTYKNIDPQKDYVIGIYAGLSMSSYYKSVFSLLNKVITVKLIKPR